MNKTTKNLTALVLIGASTLFSSGCSCRKTNSPVIAVAQAAEKKVQDNRAFILDYIKQNSESHEQIVNYIILTKEKNKSSYSKETIDNFYNAIRNEIEKNPGQMKDEIIDIAKLGLYSEYRGEIFSSLSFKQKMLLLKECSLYKTREIADDVKENIDSLDEKIEKYNPKAIEKVKGLVETGIKRANVPEAAKRVKRDANQFYENVKERIYGNN